MPKRFVIRTYVTLDKEKLDVIVAFLISMIFPMSILLLGALGMWCYYTSVVTAPDYDELKTLLASKANGENILDIWFLPGAMGMIGMSAIYFACLPLIRRSKNPRMTRSEDIASDCLIYTLFTVVFTLWASLGSYRIIGQNLHLMSDQMWKATVINFSLSALSMLPVVLTIAFFVILSLLEIMVMVFKFVSWCCEGIWWLLGVIKLEKREEIVLV